MKLRSVCMYVFLRFMSTDLDRVSDKTIHFIIFHHGNFIR